MPASIAFARAMAATMPGVADDGTAHTHRSAGAMLCQTTRARSRKSNGRKAFAQERRWGSKLCSAVGGGVTAGKEHTLARSDCVRRDTVE
jgi:hypothetical protein